MEMIQEHGRPFLKSFYEDVTGVEVEGPQPDRVRAADLGGDAREAQAPFLANGDFGVELAQPGVDVDQVRAGAAKRLLSGR